MAIAASAVMMRRRDASGVESGECSDDKHGK